MNFLSGKKTYIVGMLFVVKGCLGFVWPDLVHGDPMQDILTGLGLMGLRAGVAKGTN